jgi:hypothetical protein
MPQFIRHHVNPVPRITWVLPILAGILIGCLLAFLANFYLKEARSGSDPAVSSAPESKPPPGFKKPVRYEAVKSNWQQYRAATQPKE